MQRITQRRAVTYRFVIPGRYKEGTHHYDMQGYYFEGVSYLAAKAGLHAHMAENKFYWTGEGIHSLVLDETYRGKNQ